MSSNLNVLKPLYTSFAYHPGSLRRYMLAVILAMVGSFGVLCAIFKIKMERLTAVARGRREEIQKA